MPLPNWALAFADDAGRTSNSEAALATVTSLANLDGAPWFRKRKWEIARAFENWFAAMIGTCCGWLST